MDDRAVLLFPGAGSGADHPSLMAMEAALGPLPVERVDFGYRAAGRRFPPRADTLTPEVVAAATALAARTGLAPEDLVLGGRSMGGRVCSLAVADGLPAAGLVLVAYPLHPPGRPEKLRAAHLSRLEVPCLFVSGTRDPFATPDELAHHTATIPGPVTLHPVDGKRHDLAGRRTEAEVAAVVADWVRALPRPRRRG